MSAPDPRALDVAKAAVVTVARRAFERGLQTNTGGNLSARVIGADAFVVKASGIGFAECDASNLVTVDLRGAIIDGAMKPSQDTPIHLCIYNARPDVNGIVHVHAPWATGWASSGLEIPRLTFQAMEKTGRIPLIPTAPGGGQQTVTEMMAFLSASDVFAASLENHGIIGLGKTPLSALHVVELLEETAQVATLRVLLDARAR